MQKYSNISRLDIDGIYNECLKHLTDIEKKICNNHMKKDTVHKILEIEKYNLVPNSFVLEIIDKKVSSIKVGNINSKSETFMDNIIFRDVDNTATLYYTLDTVLDKSHCVDIELALEVDALNIVLVTPYEYYNYIDPTDIDYSLLAKIIVADCINKSSANIHIECYKDSNGEIVYPVKFRFGEELVIQSKYLLDAETNKMLVGELINKDTKANTNDILTSKGITTNSSSFITGTGIELRIICNKVKYGYHCVIRVQTLSNTTRTIDGLGFDISVTDSMYRNTRFKSGMILYTGARNTGKNTSAYAFLNEVKKSNSKLISFEHPIEVDMAYPQLDYQDNENNLLNAIKLCKKQDIQLAFINEVPSKEVASALRDLVNSSIGVVTTMHIDRIWHLPYRLYEYYGDQYKNVFSQLRVVYNQKMFLKPCPYCSEGRFPNDMQDKYHKEYLSNKIKKMVMVNLGCSNCDTEEKRMHLGVQPYCEFLEFTNDIREELYRMNYPWEMELYIKKLVTENNNNLEFYVLNAMINGEITIDAVDQFI